MASMSLLRNLYSSSSVLAASLADLKKKHNDRKKISIIFSKLTV